MLSHRHRHLPEAEAWPDDDAFFRGITLGVALSVAFYAALGLLWWAA